jgi:hypothetical protein
MLSDFENLDKTSYWEEQFTEGITGCIKFPVTIHEISELDSVVEIQEMVEYTQPKKKLNEVRIVEVGKQKVKKSKGKLF